MNNNLVFIVILTYVSLPNCASAQSVSSYNDSTSYPAQAYSNLDPTIAIIMITLFSAIILMGFISVYIRNCSESVAAPAPFYPSNAARTGHLGTASGGFFNQRQGLDPAVVSSFPILAYISVKELESGKEPGALECAICLSEFKEFDSLKLLPKCNHAFHPECIDAWLASHVTCPVCRGNLEFKLEPDSCPLRGNLNSSSSSRSSNDDNVVTNSVVSELNLQQQQQQPQGSISIVVNSG